MKKGDGLRAVEKLARLARLAREEMPPSVDVTDGVMRRLAGVRHVASHHANDTSDTFAGFWPLAAAVSAATAAAFVLAMQAFAASQEPIVELLISVRTAIQ